MFNWFKKSTDSKDNAVAETEPARPNDSAIQGGGTISQLATSESETLRSQGNAHLNNGKLEDAAACFRQSIARNPEYAEAYTNLGIVFQMQGNLNDAIALFRKAVELKPSLLPAHLNLGMCLMNLGQGEGAEESLRQVTILAAEQSAPLQHAAALQSLGVIAAQRGDFTQAETLLRRALELQPDYIDAHNNLGNLLQLTMRLSEAETCYRRVLELQPGYANAYYNLGNLLQQVNRLSEAESCYRDALKLKPDYAEANNNLGNVLQQTGRPFEAEASYRIALQMKPDYVEAHNNLGNMFEKASRLSEAEASYRLALEFQPDYPIAHFNLGKLLQQSDRLPEAETSYRRALDLKSDYADALISLGSLLQQIGRMSEAEASYLRVLELKPDYIEAYNNLGILLENSNNLPEAEAYYRQALELKPDYIESYNNLGNLLVNANRLTEAEVSYRRAMELQPDYATTHYNLGSLLQQTNRMPEAEASYLRALKLKPDFAEAHGNLGVIIRDFGKLDEALNCFRRALEIKPDLEEAHSNLLYALSFHHELSSEEIYRASQEYEAQIGIPIRSTWRAHSNDKNPNRRLRVGYVSPDFRKHPVAYFAEPILANHDKSQVEIFCYAEVKREDELTGRFRQLADHWHSTVGLSDDVVAKMIRDHQIDILVDLAGHTAKNRLRVFARKPAPIQMTYLGYPGTTGLSAMDYRLTDHYADPEGVADTYYAECLRRLPNSLWCYRPSDDMPGSSPLPALARGYLTFGSFNNFNKIDQPTLDLWAELLRALPTSRLMMLTVPEGETRRSLLRRFGDLGITAQRLEFQGKLQSAEFHRKFLEVDITLDPVTVNGATTTCESLWMGVPVISLVGTRFLTRAGMSILSAAGLADFAATSREEYILIGVRLANNIPELAKVRAGLRESLRTSPLTDELGFARNLENLYREIWRKWCSTN